MTPPLWQKVKRKGTKEPLDESERGEWKNWLKIQHSKPKIMTSSPITHGKWMGKQWLPLFFRAPKSLQMVIASMKLKDAYSLEGKL